MEEPLYTEEKMQIEVQATKAFLFAATHGNQGIDYLISVLGNLKDRLKNEDLKEAPKHFSCPSQNKINK